MLKSEEIEWPFAPLRYTYYYDPYAYNVFDMDYKIYKNNEFYNSGAFFPKPQEYFIINDTTISQKRNYERRLKIHRKLVRAKRKAEVYAKRKYNILSEPTYAKSSSTTKSTGKIYDV